MAEILRKRLAFAVKQVQWSYAIFWSISLTQNGALEWGDGYYNGDIKTRKTVQTEQLNADQLGLQRTEQLRELYESLLDAETNPQSVRPSAALSPEDLTDTEWYFLICMSFVFDTGQGLPGRTLAKNQTTWLCNAHRADSKVFRRTLLAKSASIQTVVCFPYSGGVIELGTTELVSETPSIIQCITSFLENRDINNSNHKENVSDSARHENISKCVQLEEGAVDAKLDLDLEYEKANTSSPNSCSEEFEPDYQGKGSLMAERIHEGTSRIHSWQLMEDDTSNGVLNSGESSDCISQTFVSLEKIVPRQDEDNKVTEDHLLDDSKDMELTSFEIQNDDNHYQGIVSTLFKTSHQLIMGPCLKSSIKDSCFVRWKKSRSSIKHKSGGTSQRLLKKLLYEVPLMHQHGKLRKPETDELHANHEAEKRRQRDQMQEKFVILGSIVPSTGKVDNASLLDDTIEYLRNLERKVEVLESQKKLLVAEAGKKRNSTVIESTSDNYADNRVDKCRKRVLKKRKVSDINAMKVVNHSYQEDNLTDEVTISKIGKDLVIEIRCPWREELFVDIMSAISNLHLDSHSVQSTITDRNLSLTVTSKVKGSTMPSVKIIKQALERVTRKP